MSITEADQSHVIDIVDGDEEDFINIGTVTVALLGLGCLFYFFPCKKVKKRH
jgi:hypothetical protein